MHDNIRAHVLYCDSLSQNEAANTQVVCGYGKRQLEELCYMFSPKNFNSLSINAMLESFLTSDQLTNCMGGLATLIQETYRNLKTDVMSMIKNFCTNHIRIEAQKLVEQNGILHFYTNGGEIATTAVPALINEVHFVNALYNAIADKCVWLDKIIDNYTTTFPAAQGWLETFAANYDDNKLIEIFISEYIATLTELKHNFNVDDYDSLCGKLNQLGHDPNFSIRLLYQLELEKRPINPHYAQIIEASMIKRLVASKIIELEQHENIITSKWSESRYNLYIVGKHHKFWLEEISDEGSTRFIPVKTELEPELYKTLITSDNFSEENHQQLLYASLKAKNPSLRNLLLVNREYDGKALPINVTKSIAKHSSSSCTLQ